MENLHPIITKDGTITLKSFQYKENFHSSSGALHETKHKFINPSLLKRFKDRSLSVLDICFGLGYNSAQLFHELRIQSSALKWYGLEIDKRPIKYALKNKKFIELWDSKTLEILNLIYFKGEYIDKNFNCKLLWGDARKEINKIPANINFDLIYLDAFSPQKCPEIWSEEFLSKLVSKLDKTGCLITYSSCAAIRKTFLNQGLKIFNIKPKSSKEGIWSYGTFASFETHNGNPYILELSDMEKEHLETKAAVPYRDPRGNSYSKDILISRNNEQLNSKLLDTNLWRKKWKMAK